MHFAADSHARSVRPDQGDPASQRCAFQTAELKGASNLLDGKTVYHSSILPFTITTGISDIYNSLWKTLSSPQTTPSSLNSIIPKPE